MWKKPVSNTSIGDSHGNKLVLDKLGELGGSLTYNGTPIESRTPDTINVSVYQSDLTATPFNYYNVLDNGMVGDGVTDNTVKMNQLVTSISALGGGTIYAPKGVYKITSEVIWKSNVSLIGDGKDLTIFKAVSTTTFPVFKQLTEELKNVSFHDFTVDGYEVITTSYHVQSKAFFFQKVTNAIFRDLKLVGTGATALGIDFLHDVIIDNVTTIDCGRQWQGGNDAGGAGIGIGTGWYPLENLVITNCKTYNSGQFGIFVEHQGMFSQGTEQAKGVVIDSCIVVGGRNHGIGIKGGRNITVSSCQTYENVKSGIYILASNNATNDIADLQKISIVNTTSSENGKDGIYVAPNSKIKGLVISSNILSANGGNGLTLFETASSAIVDKVVVKNNLITNNLGADLFVANQVSMTNLRISGNESINNGNNSGKLAIPSGGYVKFPSQLLDNQNNEINIKIKIPNVDATSCILSRRDTNFTTTAKPAGFSVVLKADKTIQITGYKTNDAVTAYSYSYVEPLTVGIKYFLRINYTGSVIEVQTSADGITYTPLTLNTATAVGTDADIIAVLGTARQFEPNLCREWGGSSGWVKPLGGAVIYSLKVKSTLTNSLFEYYFNNVGYNNEVYEINGTNLNGRSGGGAQQMANEIN